MSAVASHITDVSSVYSIIVQAQIKETSKFRVIGLCEGNSPVTDEFSIQIARNAENISIWWRRQDKLFCLKGSQRIEASC